MKSFLKLLGKLLLLTLVFAAGFGVHIWQRMSNTWTDGIGISRTAAKGELRYLMWEEPQPLELGVDSDNEIEPVVSGNGQVLVFAKGKAGYNADLYICERSDQGWSSPVPLASINSESDELGPALNRKGDQLWFYSDREGGIGGYDIWTARKRYGVWEDPVLLDGNVNSAFDEYDPVLDFGENQLVFASNRPVHPEDAPEEDAWKGTLRERVSARTFDIYSASRSGERELAGEAWYHFEVAEVWEVLNSDADEGQPAFSPHGDFIYFSSNRPGGAGGFDLYRMRLAPLSAEGPTPLPSPVNTPGDEMDPALWHEGHSLVFSSNAREEEAYTFRLWTTTSREVVPQPWLTWGRVKGWTEAYGLWALLLILAMLGIAWLWWLLYRSEATLGPRARALTISAMIHALFLFLLSIWFLGSAVVEQTAGPMELAVSEQNLVREKLALELREELAELSVPEMPPRQEQVTLPDDITPPELPEALQMQLPQISAAQPVFDMTDEIEPIERIESALPETMVPVMDVPDIAMTEVEVVDVSAFSEIIVMPEIQLPKRVVQADAVPAMPGAPGELSRTRSEIKVGTSLRAGETALLDVVKGLDAGEPIEVDAGVLAAGEGNDLPEIPLLAEVETGPVSLPEFTEGLTLELETAAVPSLSYHLRDPALRKELLEELGGNDETEAAIQQALAFFVKTQEEDGRWDIKKWQGDDGHDVAATGLVMLCFMGHGATHQADTVYQDVMKRSLAWLLKQQQADGRFEAKDMYDQCIATIVLAEAYGMSKDPALLEPLKKAVAYVVKAQHDGTGGWRYQPNQPGDTSVFGWGLMAISSARQSGIEVPESAFDQAKKWLDRVAGGKNGGRYGYENQNAKRRAMTAEGFFCRQLLDTPRDQANMRESAQFLSTQLPRIEDVDMYYWYYGCLSLYQHQGEIWQDWNERMRPILLQTQQKNGEYAGSWDAKGQYQERMGRIVTTALATLSLEVYYRYLPMYRR